MCKRIALLLCLLIGLPAAAQGLHDPTRPPGGAPVAVAAEGKTAEPKLSFVISTEERRLARIDGVWVSEGDEVSGLRILRIRAGSVRVAQGDRIFELAVNGGVRKTPASGAKER